ncbi:hypothetical protein [Variovorax fucosicus]|uniref:hypothetical protein n=1 Tax=Variovorax fucosicus TaxID=3053517 RepID=UPI002575C0D6|nr:hypothetical protein [Variovorax sp. J22G47]MDM0057345.1 hypothetical protein [Variovorax sp. J22G47]
MLEYWDAFWLWWHGFQRSDKIASAALLIAAGSLWVSWHYGKPQRALAHRQLRDKDIEDEKAKSALIVCRIIGNVGAYRLDFGNAGQSEARNIEVDLSDKWVAQLFEHAKSEFPWARLRPHSSFSVLAIVYNNGPDRYRFNVSWDDDSGKRKTEAQVVSTMG